MSTTHEIDWRLLRHIQERSVENKVTGCWIWTLSANGSTYSNVVRFAKHFAGGDGENHNAHRLAYIALKGPVPDGLEFDHLCQGSRCCNPYHLEPVTHSVNIMRRRRGEDHPLTNWLFPSPEITVPAFDGTAFAST